MSETNNKPNRAWGRTLSDLWLDGEEGKLHPAEWELLRCAGAGEFCTLGDERPNYPTKENRIRSELLRFIALGGDEQNSLHDHGVQLKGAYVECSSRKLDFYGSVLQGNLHLLKSKIDGNIDLQDSVVDTIAFQGCHVDALSADRMETNGSLHLDQCFQAAGEVRLCGAKIGGTLDCSNACLLGEVNALNCDGIETEGDVFFNRGFQSSGEVRLLGAKIGGTLDCSDARFNGKGDALSCDRIETKGTIFLNNGFCTSGAVRLLNARIGGNLSSKAGFFATIESGLYAQRAEIVGNISLDEGFLSFAMVDLSDITIHGNLYCNGGTFSNKEKSIHAPRATVRGSVFLGRECRIAGPVSFQSATIDGDITFAGGSFESRDGINMRNAAIKGMVVWRDVEYARGELNLAGASCLSLNMDWMSWKKPAQVRLDNFTYERFAELPDGCNGRFWIDWLERQPERHLKSRFRPNPYQHLAKVLDQMGHEAEARDVRIERMDRQRLFSRYYEPMPDDNWARGLRRMGNFWKWLQKKFIGYGYRPALAVIWLAGLISVGAIVYELAARQGVMTPTHPLIFKEAIWEAAPGEAPTGKIPIACRENWVYPAGDIAATCQSSVASEYSTFNSIIYSFDIAIPVVNFRMEGDWAPRVVDWQTGESDRLGWWVRTWEWLQIGLGWLFSLLLVGAWGGVIKRE